MPLDLEQMLTKRDLGELLGASPHAVNSWVERRHVQSTVVGGWPGPGNPKRRLISVRELLRVGLLTGDGQSTFVPPVNRRGQAKESRAKARVPQRSIPDDLPTDLGDPRIGIEDPDLAALVLVGLSRFPASEKSRSGDACYRALRLLRRYAHTEVSRAGVVYPAPCPEVDPALRVPTGVAVANNLQLPPRYRQDEWRRLVDADSVTAAFDVNFVARHVPPALWRVFAALVRDGTALANDRLRRVVYYESHRSLKHTRAERGPSATLAESSVRTSVTSFRRFFIRALVPMYYDGYPSESLNAWTHAPPPLEIEAVSWNADRSAPGRPLLRLTWQRMDREVRTRIATALRDPHEFGPNIDIDAIDALQVVRRLPRSRLAAASLFRVCRNRALLACFAVLGGRRGATTDLDRGDYKHDFLGPDGVLTAAIALRPGKHARRDEISWKLLPAGMGQVLGLYLLVVERHLGAPLPADGPLFIPDLTDPGRHMSGTALTNIMAGAETMRPLLPKPRLVEASSENLFAGSLDQQQGSRGYSPQSLRRAALQLVRHGARRYCETHDIEADPGCLAEVLLDHKDIHADTMGYADVNTVQGRIRWSQVAIAINWEMLTTDRGARWVPDERRFKEALELQEALQGELKRAKRDLEQLFEARYSGVSDGLIVEVMVAVHRVYEIQTALADIGVTIVTLEHDRDRWLALPDDAPDQKVDLRAVRRGERGTPRRPASNRLRWFLTVPEFAEFAGSLATARRWAGGRTPYPDGDPRNPWQPGDGTVDTSLAQRKRRIDVDKINHRYFDTVSKRARRDEILATIPRGFNPTNAVLRLRPRARTFSPCRLAR